MKRPILFIFLFFLTLLWSCHQTADKHKQTTGTPPAENSQAATPASTTPKVTEQTPSSAEAPSTAATKAPTPEKNLPETPAPTKQSQAAPTISLPVAITNPDLGIGFHLPEGWHQNGKTIKALGRKGEWLNSEAVYTDKNQSRTLSVKVHPAPFAAKLWKFHQKQFADHKGLFEHDSRPITINGHQGLFGVSLRQFDGKGHPLNPPAKVYAAVWYDPQKNMEYEMIYRTNRPDSSDKNTFLSILKTVSPN